VGQQPMTNVLRILSTKNIKIGLFMTDEYKNNEKDAFSETQCTAYVIILKLTLHAAN